MLLSNMFVIAPGTPSIYVQLALVLYLSACKEYFNTESRYTLKCMWLSCSATSVCTLCLLGGHS